MTKTANASPGYYSKIFRGMQQKEISGNLTLIWQEDPFKAKWSILAKSYSLIRDNQGKIKAPLDKFLAINGPLIGIIKPENYLRALNWEIARDEDGGIVMYRQDKPVDDRYFITNTSVNDVLLHSYRQGYFTGNLSAVLSADNEASMTMATSVQPANQLAMSSRGEDHTVQAAATSDAAVSNEEEATTITMDLPEDTTEAAAMTTIVDGVVSEDDQMSSAEHSSAAIQNEASAADWVPTTIITTTIPASPAFDIDDMTPVSRATYIAINAGLAESRDDKVTPANVDDVPSLSSSAFQLQSQWPHNVEFDPELPSNAVFDPFCGNQFNVFEMSDFDFDDFLDPDAF